MTVNTFTSGITASSTPYGMTYNPGDGNIWFGEYTTGKICKITPAGTVTEYATPSTTGTNPRGMCYGPDGNIWYCGYGNNKIGKITSSGTVTEYTCPTAGAPFDICSDGTNLWFAYSSAAKVCKVTTGGSFTEYSITSFVGAGICLGPDGNLWAVDSGNHKVQKITTGGSVTGYSMTTSSDAFGIVSDGTNLWYGAYSGNKIVKVTTSGTMTEYSTSGGPYRLAYASGDGCVYFTTNASGSVKLKKATSAGTVSDVSSTGTAPFFIAYDAYQGIWWADGTTNAIYQFTPVDHPVVTPALSMTMALPAPTIGGTSPNATVTAPALAMSVTLPTPTVTTSNTIYDAAVLAESSLQSYWKLTEASGNGADSEGSVTATAAGTLTYSQAGPGSVGNGVKSNGSNPTAFDCGDVYRFTGTANYTAEAWFKPTTGGGSVQRLISKMDGALGFGWDLSYYVTDGTIYAQRHNGTTGTLTNSAVGTVLTPGTWYHIACTYDGARLRVYLNGVLESGHVADTNSMVGGTTELSILNSAKNNSVTRLPTNGTMTHVAIYNAALSASSLLSHYNAGFGSYGATVVAPPLAVGVANNLSAGPYIDSTATLDTVASVSVGFVAPAVSGAFGSSNPTVTATPFTVAVTLPAPVPSTGVPGDVTATPLAVGVALRTPVISTGSGGPTGATVVAPPLTVAVTLPAPFTIEETAYYWIRARRSSMNAPTKTYVQAQAKGTTRTATWTSPTYEAKTEAGILVVLDVTSASGTGGLTLRINAHDQASSQAVPLNTAPTAVIATGTTSYVLYPFGAVAGSVTQATSFYLPRLFSITVTHGDSSSYTYSVGFCLLP